MRGKYAIPAVIVMVSVIIGGVLLMRYPEGLSGVTSSEKALFWTPSTRGTISYISRLKGSPEHLSIKFYVPENVLENIDGVEMYRLRVEDHDENWVRLFRKEDLAPNLVWRGYWIKPRLDVGESWSFAGLSPMGIQGKMKVTSRKTTPVGDDEYEVFTLESSAFSPRGIEGDYKVKVFYSEDIHMILGEQGLLRENEEDEFELVKDWHITSLELASTE